MDRSLREFLLVEVRIPSSSTKEIFCLLSNFYLLLRFVVRCIEKFSVYLLEIKIQITDIFYFYLL